MKSPNNNLGFMLLRSARAFPEYPAIAVGTKTVRTYAEMLLRVQTLAQYLRFRLDVGDRVLINSPNCSEYLETLFACWWAGMIAVPVNAKLHPKEVADIADRCMAKMTFCAEGGDGIQFGGIAYQIMATQGAAMNEPHPVDLSDPAWLFFTSGTTGKPKGAILTHGNLRAMCHAFLVDVCSVDPGDSMIHAAPLSHGSGLYALPHVMKAACNVTIEGGHFDAFETESLLHCTRASVTFGPTTIMNRILDAREQFCWDDGHGLKAMIYGGAPVYLDDIQRAWKITNGHAAQIYGQGESPCTITGISQPMYAAAFERNDGAILRSVGWPQAGVQIKIGEGGEVLVRGTQVMHGYWVDRVATEKALADGWLHTGDIGVIDERGLLTLTGRANDTIISGGSNIYPQEVEGVLLKHPSVKEAAVLGRPHQDLGEQVVAVIVPNGKASEEPGFVESLNGICLAHIARYKRPRAYFFLPELPVTAYGKPDRQALRKVVA